MMHRNEENRTETKTNEKLPGDELDIGYLPESLNSAGTQYLEKQQAL